MDDIRRPGIPLVSTQPLAPVTGRAYASAATASRTPPAIADAPARDTSPFTPRSESTGCRRPAFGIEQTVGALAERADRKPMGENETKTWVTLRGALGAAAAVVLAVLAVGVAGGAGGGLRRSG